MLIKFDDTLVVVVVINVDFVVIVVVAINCDNKMFVGDCKQIFADIVETIGGGDKVNLFEEDCVNCK